MRKSAVNKGRLAATTLHVPHHTCAGNWESKSLHRERLDQSCSTWPQTAKSSFLQTGRLLRSWKLACHGLWSQGLTSRASMKSYLIKEADDV